MTKYEADAYLNRLKRVIDHAVNNLNDTDDDVMLAHITSMIVTNITNEFFGK